MQKVDPLRLVLAVLLPPIGALLQVGVSHHFFINILLTLFGVVPGVIHALWLVLKNKQS
jgi:uncharacterized membrane protein YqaE (UPF0057 family)